MFVNNKYIIKCILLRHGATEGNKEKRYIGCRTDEPLSEEGRTEILKLRNSLPELGCVNYENSSAEDGFSSDNSVIYEHRSVTAAGQVCADDHKSIISDKVRTDDHQRIITGSQICADEHQRIITASQISNREKAPALLFVSPMRRARQTAEILFPGYEQTAIDELAEMDFGRFEGKNYQELNGDPDYQNWIDSGGKSAFPDGEEPEAFRSRSFKGFKKALDAVLAAGCNRVYIVAHGGTLMSVMSRLTGKEYFDFMVSCGEGYAFTCAVTEADNGEKKYSCCDHIKIRSAQ